MPITPNIHRLFGHFQNLNLLALMHDLRGRRMAWQAWLSVGNLCPVAHGLPSGKNVRELSVLGQNADLDSGCDYAAKLLGSDATTVYRFVQAWDNQAISPDWLLGQLKAMWRERLEDAVAMQELLNDGDNILPLVEDNQLQPEYQELLV